MNITPIVYAMGVGRILIGLAPIAAPQLSSKLLRFPAEHDNATARLMGRFFGVRDIGLGVLVIYAVADIALLKWIFLFQAATDAADALCIAPNLRDPKMKKAAAASLAFALGGGSLWLIARARLARHSSVMTASCAAVICALTVLRTISSSSSLTFVTSITPRPSVSKRPCTPLSAGSPSARTFSSMRACSAATSGAPKVPRKVNRTLFNIRS